MNARAIKKKFTRIENRGWGAEYREVYLSVRSGKGVLAPGLTMDELVSSSVHPMYYKRLMLPVYGLPLYWSKGADFIGEWSGRDWWELKEKVCWCYWHNLCSEIRQLSRYLGMEADLRVHRNPPYTGNVRGTVIGRKTLQKRGQRECPY